MDYPKIESLLTLAEHAGAAIMKIYEGVIEVEAKSDSSPLTQADLAAHKVIATGLSSLSPDIPVLSEEGELPDFAERQGWQCYWLVDPLDGTKEFIKRNGEFTVNIALIENGRAVRSVVLAPALGTAYWGCRQDGAFKRDADGKIQQIRCRRLPEQGWKVVVSRSHRAPAVDALLKTIPPHDSVPTGSSLKFCLIAEGAADFYPKLGHTSEWDTAAGQCILEAAGGAVIKTDGKTLRYNRKEEMLNPHFLAVSTAKYDWVALLD